ncbi:4-(cytidine 5'-diphospho)-2-C-methyl-D-erythritol kinase [candidate division KSB1 bacterium]|nr:4-(cytidine 5'-diphospho)-2-C-methyl-D-erythritol kinase [candidate division KSB1 bacterium]
MNAIQLPSYAKINLGLLIKGKRADGFHEIETILQQISLCDNIKLTLTESSRISLQCSDGALPRDASNLCVQAARLLKDRTGYEQGVDIALEKNIPVGAGLGGGSSNAAVVLLGLNKMLNLKLSAQQLEEMAATLGSDIPFFIRGGTCLATGRGEILQQVSLDLSSKTVLIVFPGIPISTKRAYENLDLTKRKKYLTLSSFEEKKFNDVEFFKVIRNDFEESVFPSFPALGHIKRQMNEHHAAFVGLSGSGSALFALFGKRRAAEKARNALEEGFAVFVAEFVHWGYAQINSEMQVR